MNTTSPPSWAEHELGHAHLGDPRRTDRLVLLAEALARQPEGSIPLASGSWAATKAAYRFFDNDAVAPAAILQAHRATTLGRLPPQGTLLAIQDTTAFDFTTHPATTGLGYLGHPKHHGLLVHSTLLASAAGVPLGLLRQQVWVRDPKGLGKRQDRRSKETRDKESQRWLDGLQAVQDALPPERTVVVVGDREADFYDLFAAPRRPGTHLLIRAKGRRRVQHEAGLLGRALQAAPVQGCLHLELPRSDGRPARWAKLTVRFGSFAIQPPATHPRRRELPPLRLQAVLVEEAEAPAGVKPVRWLLVTTVPIRSLEDAWQVVRWYALRWLIERYHYVLKSGCRVEALQLETAARLQRALAVYAVVAWRLLWLTYAARAEPEGSCAPVWERQEWQVLYEATHPGAAQPAQVPSLGEAVGWLAQLGGFLARQGDGAPGVKVLWRGLRRLEDLVRGYRLARRQQQASPLVGKG